MNIFYLDKNPKRAAEYHCDKHVVKMILEYAQLLSNAHHLTGSPNEIINKIYKPTHLKHPCTQWVIQSVQHYNWLYSLFYFLNKEYELRYKKIHKTFIKLNETLKNPPINLKDNGFIDPPKAMPDYCKLNNTVESYRNYYNLEKIKFAKWKNNNIPYWFGVKNE